MLAVVLIWAISCMIHTSKNSVNFLNIFLMFQIEILWRNAFSAKDLQFSAIRAAACVAPNFSENAWYSCDFNKKVLHSGFFLGNFSDWGMRNLEVLRKTSIGENSLFYSCVCTLS